MDNHMPKNIQTLFSPTLYRMGKISFCMVAYLDSYRQAQWELENKFLKCEVGPKNAVLSHTRKKEQRKG